MKTTAGLALLGLTVMGHAFSQYRIKEYFDHGVKLYPLYVNNDHVLLTDTLHQTREFYSQSTGFVEIPDPDFVHGHPLDWFPNYIGSDGAVYGIFKTDQNTWRPLSWNSSTGFRSDYSWPFSSTANFTFGAANTQGKVTGWIQEDNPFFPYGTAMWDSPNSAAPLPMFVGEINDQGYIAGSSYDYKAQVRRPDGTILNLPWQYSSTDDFIASSINEAGLIAGEGRRSGHHELLIWDLSGHLVRRWRAPASLQLGNDAFINESGLVSFTGYTSGNPDIIHAYLWSLTESPVDLNSLMEPGSLIGDDYIRNVWSLDDSGRMIANVVHRTSDGGHDWTNVLIEPVPEPGSLAVLALGAAALLRRRRNPN